jgi:hypothetical protein
MRFNSFGVLTRVLGADRQEPVSEATQHLAHGPLGQGYAKVTLYLGRQVDASPADYPIHFRIRSGLQPFGDPRHLLARQPWILARRLAVRQPLQTLRIVAVNPIPKGLPIHSSLTGRISPRRSLQNHRKRKHAPRRIRVPAHRRKPAQ